MAVVLCLDIPWLLDLIMILFFCSAFVLRSCFDAGKLLELECNVISSVVEM